MRRESSQRETIDGIPCPQVLWSFGQIGCLILDTVVPSLSWCQRPDKTEEDGTRSGLLHPLLPERIFSLEIDLGFTEHLPSRLPPTHNESLQVQIFVWCEDANSRRLFSLKLVLPCHTGSISLWLQQCVESNLNVVLGTLGALSPKDRWWGRRRWKSAL